MTMQRKDEVAVYYINQNIKTEKPCRIMTRAEARAAKKANQGWFISHGRAFRLRDFFAISSTVEQHLQASIPSCCGISKSEILANVGIAGPFGYDANNFTVLRAQEKIRLYPIIHDRKACFASGRWTSTNY